MTKILYDSEEILHNVQIHLNDATNSLNNAKNIALSFSIPTSFEFFNLLNGLSTGLNNDANRIEQIKDWLRDSQVEFDRSFLDLKRDVDKINEITIRKNDNIVK